MTESPTITFDRLQTIGGSSFDLETVSVAVGRLVETEQLKLVITDVKNGNRRELKFNLDATEDQVKRLIEFTAQEMGMIAAPARHKA